MNKKLLYLFIGLFIILIVIPVILTLLNRNDWFYAITSVALLSIASAGVWLTFYIGRINIGQGAFCLLGGYVTAILVTKYGLNFWFTIPISGLVCVVFSIFVGLPILRLKGVYFAMITLVLTEVMRLFTLVVPITNGARGIISIPLPQKLSIFGITVIPDFSTIEHIKVAFYYLATIIMIITFFGVYRLVHSRLGHLCRSLQQNEELASSIGVNVAYLRIIIYAISSFLGSITGSVFVVLTQSIYPSSFAITDSVNFILYCFLGGLGSVLGPIVGTFVLYFGWDLLFKIGKWQLLVYSSILVLLMVFLPNGLMSIKFKRNNQ